MWYCSFWSEGSINPLNFGPRFCPQRWFHMLGFPSSANKCSCQDKTSFPRENLETLHCAMPILSFGGDSCRSNASCGDTGPGAFLSRIRGGFRENPGQAATWHHSSTQEFSFLPSTDSTSWSMILLIVTTMERLTWAIILVKEMRSCQC